MEFVHQPRAANRIGDYLRENLESDWDHFRAAVAFVKRSGTKHIAESLKAFSAAKTVEIIAGIDHQGSSLEGLSELLTATSPNGKVVIFHNRLHKTFHPKIYLFKSGTRADVLIGSGNLTEGGLFSNYEACVRLQLDLNVASEAAMLKSVEDILNEWGNLSSGTTAVLDEDLLIKLNALGLVPKEIFVVTDYEDDDELDTDDIEDDDDDSGEDTGSKVTWKDLPFGAVQAPGAPSAKKKPTVPQQQVAGVGQASGQTAPLGSSAEVGPAKGFVMTLQNTDVGKGQTGEDTQQRSPEIFIPLLARDTNPTFWGWPNAFVTDPEWTGEPDKMGRGKMDRNGVRVRLGSGETISVNIWYNPVKKDIRIRSERLRSGGSVDDIIRIERAESTEEFDYYIEFVPKNTSQYETYRKLCKLKPRSTKSKKYFGYY